MSRIILMLAAACFSVSFAHACEEKNSPCERQIAWLNSFNAFGLTLGEDLAPGRPKFDGRYSTEPAADLQIVSEWGENAAHKRKELVLVSGSTVIERGDEIDAEHPFDAISEAMVMARLGAALLVRAFPQGATSMEPHNEIEIENGSDLIEVAFWDAGGAFAGPWSLKGAADRDASGRVSYRLDFFSREPQQRAPFEPSRVFNVSLEGYFENKPERFALNDDDSLTGWTIFDS